MQHKEKTKGQEKQRIAKKSDVWHNIQRGILFDVYYDTETTDLDKRFSDITEFGGVITDIAGNVLHLADYQGQPSGYNVISPPAWVIQRMDRKRLEQGDPYPILAGKVKRFFDWSNNLSEAPYQDGFLKLCRNTKEDNELFYSYPLMNDEGHIDWDSVRLDRSLKHLYYKDDATGEWVKKKIAAMTNGYNNVGADDPWIWTLQHMGLADNIFLTHLKKQYGKYRNDILRVVEAAVAVVNNKNILKAGKNIDPVTKEKRPSFKQGDILKANTRIGSHLLDIAEGITLPDGSYVDVDQLHGAFNDAFALVGLKQYLRQHVPDILRQMEMNGDWANLKERLTVQTDGFGVNPIHTYIDKSFPLLNSTMVSLVGTDIDRHNSKLALVANVCTDPRSVRIAGKTIKQASVQELATLIRDSQQSPNGIFKLISLHKYPRILDQKTGFKIGANHGLSPEHLRQNQRYFEDRELVSKLTEALKIVRPQFLNNEYQPFIQAEEQLFSFPAAELYDRKNGDTVQIYQTRDDVFINKYAQSRENIFKQNKYWLRALQMSHDIFLETFADPGAEYEAAQKYAKVQAELAKKLAENNAPLLPAFDGTNFYARYSGGKNNRKLSDDIYDYKTALQYHLRLLLTARNYFAQNKLQDIGHHFWFEDEGGYRLEYDDVKDWPDWRIERDFRKLNVVHEIVPHTAERIDRVIEALGYARILGPNVLQDLAALRSVRVHGIQNGLGSERWNTIEKSEGFLQRIKSNEYLDEDIKAILDEYPGAWEIFIEGLSGKEHSLGEYEEYLGNLRRNAPQPTPETYERLGINPETRKPYEQIDYELSSPDIISIDVPDRYLEQPTIDPNTGQNLWVLPLTQKFNDKAIAGKHVCLRGQQTGKVMFVAKAKRHDPPAHGGMYGTFYKQVRAKYSASGVKFDPKAAAMALSGEGPYPVHNMRPVDLTQQSIRVAKEIFESLIAPALAGYKFKPSGFILRDDAFQVSSGLVRLREIDPETDKISGWEFSARIKKAERKSLHQIRRMSDKTAQKYGYRTKDAMVQDVSTQFTALNKDPRDVKNKVWMIEVGGIDVGDAEHGMTYLNPMVGKRAAMRQGEAFIQEGSSALSL